MSTAKIPVPRVRELREAAGMNQSRLAGAAGLSQADISHVENGLTVNPSQGLRLAVALGVDVEELSK